MSKGMKDLLGRPVKEKEIQDMIRAAIAPMAMCFRGNVGKFRTQDGRWMTTGLPNGFPDLFGFRKKDGKMFFIEVKTCRGKLSEEQKKWRDILVHEDVIYGVARDPGEAIEILKGAEFHE